jgi:predicted metal-dependent peptidase
MHPVAEAQVRAGRAKAAYLRPYFSHALYALIPVHSDEVPTMAVDKWGRLYFNAEFVLACDVDELATCCIHEIGHVLRHHHERAEALGVTIATHMVANIAQDCELNDDIAEEVKARKDLHELPPGAMYPSRFGFSDGQTWEVYYELLMNELEKHKPTIDGGAGGDGDGDGKRKGAARKRSHKCGSGATGVQQPWEQPGPSSGGGEGIEDADWRDIERHVASEIRDEAAKGRGTVPGAWISWAEEVLRIEQIPWDQELAGAVRWAVNDAAGKVIHNYKRPSRRQQAMPDIVFPGMRRPVPSVALVGDTSGSMSEKDLSLVRGVIQDVCEAVNAALTFIATDAAVHGVQRVTDGSAAEMRGRGGTDMCVGIQAAIDDVQPRPDVIIVATDCETPWPAIEPEVPIIVCAIGAHETSVAAIPQWARVIIVKEDP